MGLISTSFASAKMCDSLLFSQHQKSEVFDVVDQYQLRVESLDEEYKINKRLYEEYLRDFPQTNISIQEVIERMSQSQYELEEIKMNQFVYVFEYILRDKQRILLPMCNSRLMSMISENMN